MDKETANKIIDKIENRKKHYEHILAIYKDKIGEWELTWVTISRIAIDECNDIIKIINHELE